MHEAASAVSGLVFSRGLLWSSLSSASRNLAHRKRDRADALIGKTGGRADRPLEFGKSPGNLFPGLTPIMPHRLLLQQWVLRCHRPAIEVVVQQQVRA